LSNHITLLFSTPGFIIL